jgi:hypothetical protein
MSERLPVVSTHIEKTAGTSLERFFLENFNPERVLIYSAITGTLVKASNKEVLRTNPVIDKIRRQFRNTPIEPLTHKFISKYLSASRGNHILIADLPNTDFDVIHGHFRSDQFDGLLPKTRFDVVVLRDPLERMVSHYEYWRRTEGAPTHRIQIPFDPTVSFENYAMNPANQNFQAQSLGGRSLKSFDLVGVMQRMDDFVRELGSRVVGLENPPVVQKLNVSPNASRGPIDVTTSFREKFEEFHQRDYLLYNEAREIVASY